MQWWLHLLVLAPANSSVNYVFIYLYNNRCAQSFAMIFNLSL